MLDWGDDPASKEEAALARFLSDLQRKIEDTLADSERIKTEWKRALQGKEWQAGKSEQWHRVMFPPKPIWTSSCPLCMGEGRVTHIDTDFTIQHTINEKCPGCHGSGKCIELLERKGVRP